MDQTPLICRENLAQFEALCLSLSGGGAHLQPGREVPPNSDGIVMPFARQMAGD
ncbi:MAG: hypothetical protein Kow00124_12090 [Anaerolineae bacterium]